MPAERTAASGHATDFFDGNDRMLARSLAVVSKEIVAGRNEEMFDTNQGRGLPFDPLNMRIESYRAAASTWGSPKAAAAW
jgi:hypothetical protein